MLISGRTRGLALLLGAFGGALFAAVFQAGCSSSSAAPAQDSSGAAVSSDTGTQNKGKGKYLIYETEGRQVVVEALGQVRETKFRRRIFAGPRALRTEDLNGGPTVIMRLDRKVMWQIDTKNRTYNQITFGQYAAKFEADRQLVAPQLKSRDLTPQQRRALEFILGIRRPEVSMETADEPVEMLGYECRHTRYYEERSVRVEEWVTDKLELPCDLTELRALTGDFSKELLGLLRKRSGFGLKTRVFGRLPTLPRLTETEVTAVRTVERLDPALFEVPAGYSRSGNTAR